MLPQANAQDVKEVFVDYCRFTTLGGTLQVIVHEDLGGPSIAPI